MLSRDSLEFLQDLLNRTQLPVRDPQWRQTAQQVAKAQDELAAALDSLNEPRQVSVGAEDPAGPRLHPVDGE